MGITWSIKILLFACLLMPAAVGCVTSGVRPRATQAAPKSLWAAARDGDLAQLESRLKEEGVSADMRNADNQTALMIAARHGQLGVCKALVAHGADVHATDGNRETPLSFAMAWRPRDTTYENVPFKGGLTAEKVTFIAAKDHTPQLAVISFLIDSGADVNHRPSSGATLLAGWLGFKVVGVDNYLDVARILVERGADVNAKGNDGSTALMRASRDLEVVKLLVNNGADVNARDNNGSTALISASSHLDVVKYLLERGADINARNDKWGQTALIYAIQNGREETPALIKFLVEHGADVNAKNKNGLTPLMLAASDRRIPFETIKFLVKHGADATAKDSKGKTAMDVLLLNKGADVNTRDKDGRPVLMSVSSHLEVVTYVVERGADVNARDDQWGTTPLMHAIMSGGQEMPALIRFLVEHGANVNARNHEGLTPLMLAGQYDQTPTIESIKFLVEHGADVNAKNNDGKTALERLSGRPAVVRFLESVSARAPATKP